ncbi:MAG: hypothetical protein FJZ00_11295, partial [Candidatus Sericytochromatia bacterium]|nr:hypothetical protein [Candidatus Tanganyikabacteria bacterium]
NRSVLKKIAGLESKRINASEEGTSSAQIWFLGKDSALGGPTGGTSIGMQTSGGALALFRDADDDDDFVKSKLVDYVQWGQAPSTAYSMESVAVAAGLWKAGTYVQGTSPGKEMNPITKGATGSENWKVTDQDDD